MSRVKAEDNNAMKSLQVRVNMRLARGNFFRHRVVFLRLGGQNLLEIPYSLRTASTSLFYERNQRACCGACLCTSRSVYCSGSIWHPAEDLISSKRALG